MEVVEVDEEEVEDVDEEVEEEDSEVDDESAGLSSLLMTAVTTDPRNCPH